MYLGTQNLPRNNEECRQLAQLGVRHVCFDPPGNPHDWSIDDLKRHRDRMESFGLVLDMVQLPLSSRPIEDQHGPDILFCRARSTHPSAGEPLKERKKVKCEKGKMG